MSVSLPITALAMSTLSALLARMNAMVSNQPFRKARSASGFCAISLLVAKITWMWKSFTRSPKRIRMRNLPLRSRVSAVEMSVTMPSISLRSSAAICGCVAPIGVITMPLGPKPCWRDVSLNSQYKNEPTVETLTRLPLRSATVFTVSSLRTSSVSSSGGPAMAAIALIGEPLAMNAMAGPEPSAMSIESDAIACCSLASPANAIDWASMPYFWKKPFLMPMSSGTNEKASGTAFPTRSVSAAPAGAASASASAMTDSRETAQVMAIPRSPDGAQRNPGSPFPHYASLHAGYIAFLLRQERLGVELAHVGLRRQRFHLDERAAQHRQRLRVEAARVREHRHQLVVDAGRGRGVGAHHLRGDLDALRLVAVHELDGLEPAGEEPAQRPGLLGDRRVGREDHVDDEVLQQG